MPGLAILKFLVGAVAAVLVLGVPPVGLQALAQEPVPDKTSSDDIGEIRRAARAAKKEARPGVFTQLEQADGALEYAVDPAPRYAPDAPPRAKKVTWSGVLTLDEAGTYRFAAEFAGKVVWKLDQKILLSESSDQLTSRASEPIELNSGEHALTIEFTPREKGGALRTFWMGPKFLAEPLPERVLHYGFVFEVPEITQAEITGDLYPNWRRGKELYEKKRCGACHDLLGEPAPDAVSDLAALGRGLKPAWVTKHLAAAQGVVDREMPLLELSADEAASLAGAICPPQEERESVAAGEEALRKKGEELLTTTGCLACHGWKENRLGGRTAGGDLSLMGDQWSRAYLEKWLAEPSAVRPQTRMPKPDLTLQERAAIVALLASAVTSSEATPSPIESAKPPARDSAAEVRGLAQKHRCASCHVLPAALRIHGGEQPRAVIQGDFENSCLQAPTAAHPGYRLTGDDARAIKAYCSSKRPESIYARFRQLPDRPLVRHGCTQCHARGGERGLRGTLLDSLAEDAESLPDRFAELATLLPPSLESVGDKLLAPALRASIERTAKTPRERPWLGVRMPHYRLAAEELKAILAQLTLEDQVPETIVALLSPPPASDRTNAELEAAGARLVTTDGFSCTSCHDIGKWKASPAKPAARGTDLAHSGPRLRESWFYRWLRNPARISPNMEMPSVQVAAKGVLSEDLNLQTRALWQALRKPGFTPPSSGALRVLAGDPSPGARRPIAYLMDVVVADGKTYLKPLVFAFPNQVNLLWDMEENRLVRFWLGPAARQYTRGKEWYWQAEGENLLPPSEASEPDFVLMEGGQAFSSVSRAQFLTEIDSLRIEPGQVELQHRLHFDLPGGRKQVVIATQTWRPLARTSATPSLVGFERGLRFNHLADGQSIEHKIAPGKNLRNDQREQVQIEKIAPSWFRVEYLTSASPPVPNAASPHAKMDLVRDESRLVPGFLAARLPLPQEIMPTALAWRPSGKLGVASLRGRIWEASDEDGDGVEETAAPFTDELAAPYGLAGTEAGYDLLVKGGLYRASDKNNDGVADELKRLASGWGHTTDYHDWAVGLPSDGQGGYYVALPCQQDERSPEAAKYRGNLLHLSPRSATLADPASFAIEVLSSGHRFPMGIARRAADGELFVTDNQGNYNPFNELNHVAGGRFFGFVNQLEKKAKSPVPALTAPAIDLPHPWTRSVNGICFLESAGGKFEPLEGHLVGCEYDTRRLVRMTLQKVGDTFQGAVYPFSRDPAPEGLSFLGPVSCAISPRGELYVGSMKDSGWGAGNNVGEVFQLKFAAERLPAGILEVSAIDERRLKIRFHGAIDAGAARRAGNYRIESYTRVSTPAYGGEDQQRRPEAILGVELDEGSGCAMLTLDKLRAGFVYEIRVDLSLAGGKDFFPAEAHFSFRRAP